MAGGVRSWARIAPPDRLRAEDAPNDAGGVIALRWVASPDDLPGRQDFLGYRILRARAVSGPYDSVGQVPRGFESFDDAVPNTTPFWYRVVALAAAFRPAHRAVST